MIRSLMRFFFQGLLILLPVVLTIYLVYLIFTALNETVFSAIGSLLAHYSPALEPGLTATLIGTAVTLIVITATGVAGSLYLGRYMMGYVDRFLERIPLVKLLYNALKDLFHAFLGDTKSFDKPVLVYLTEDKRIKAMGFMTRESMESFGLQDQVAVYLPQSYNFAGNLIIVPKSQVEPLDVAASQVTAFVVSGGVSTERNNGN